MDGISLLRDQLKRAHGFLEETMQDVTPEQARWSPPGTANSLGATYAHLVAAEDAMVHAVAKEATPLYASAWGDRTGLSEPPPPPDASWEEWTRHVQVDLPAVRAYSQAVFAATDEYIGTAADADLGRAMDLSEMGLGQQTVGWFLGNIVLQHVNNHCGEISCLKGLQGAKGYPF